MCESYGKLDREHMMKPFCVIRWLNCDEYHAHSDACCYMRAMRWSDSLNQKSIISAHDTMEEAQKEVDKLEKKTTTEFAKAILPLNQRKVHMASGMAFEKFVKEVYPQKEWKFPFQSSPEFVPSVTAALCQICEDAVETWLSGINGKHYHISVTSLIRHFAHKGLIPEGHYLVIANPKMYGDRLSDESAYEGNAKGVF